MNYPNIRIKYTNVVMYMMYLSQTTTNDLDSLHKGKPAHLLLLKQIDIEQITR